MSERTAELKALTALNAKVAAAVDSGLFQLLRGALGDEAARAAFARVQVVPSLLRPAGERVSRAELAQALNMALFLDVTDRVPMAAAYVADLQRDGQQLVFDHGALRTVAWPSGALPPGEAAITRVLRPLGFTMAATYPLPRLKMTGRAWRHADFPEDIAQFFVSELHPERFSGSFQGAVTRVLSTSQDPLTPGDLAMLEHLARDGDLPISSAVALLPKLVGCFARQHGLFEADDYQLLLTESAEMAWIATEGNAFNHATDRVADIESVVSAQRALDRPVKDSIETSATGRVRQTAFKAARVMREFLDRGQRVMLEVPGSFHEFIQRAPLDESGALDLAFDAGNATGIFKMTAGAAKDADTTGEAAAC
ncbi:2-oxoadipate dioxygenase/decarboxylase family protein [Roseateles chitinivorans]|uniref:2-oxoadipate dioxygenase/decarboxylase family protein n=1 Tax=Roseateles chitinivorans TaxID=2917965 RepID=UPI003D677207